MSLIWSIHLLYDNKGYNIQNLPGVQHSKPTRGTTFKTYVTPLLLTIVTMQVCFCWPLQTNQNVVRIYLEPER